MPLDEHHVEVEGLKISFIAAGAGPPLILLHGVGANASDWQWVMPMLASEYRVIAPNLPGYTGFDNPDFSFSQPAYTRVVAAFMRKLGIERATVVGNSLGGAIVIRLTKAHPELVSAMVLVDSGGLGHEVHPYLATQTIPGVGELECLLCKNPVGSFYRTQYRRMLLFANPANAPHEWVSDQIRLGLTPNYLEALLASLRGQVAPWGQRFIVLDDLEHFEVPTLVIWGEYDRILPVQQGKAAVSRLRNGRLVVIPGSGHIPQVEKPKEFVSALGGFLSEHSVFPEKSLGNLPQRELPLREKYLEISYDG